MERGCKRCALAAELQISPTKVGNSPNAGAFCNDVRVADLQRIRRRRVRRVTESLSMAADCLDLVGNPSGLRKKVQGRIPEAEANLFVQRRYVRHKTKPRIVSCGEQLFTQRLRVGELSCRQYVEAVIAEADERGIDTVHARPGHQADIKFRHLVGISDCETSLALELLEFFENRPCLCQELVAVFAGDRVGLR